MNKYIPNAAPNRGVTRFADNERGAPVVGTASNMWDMVCRQDLNPEGARLGAQLDAPLDGTDPAAEIERLKDQLQCAAWGTRAFEGVGFKKENIAVLSGLHCLDFDYLTDPQLADAISLCEDFEDVVYAFRSPRRAGLKVVFVIAEAELAIADLPRDWYKAYKAYVKHGRGRAIAHALQLDGCAANGEYIWDWKRTEAHGLCYLPHEPDREYLYENGAAACVDPIDFYNPPAPIARPARKKKNVRVDVQADPLPGSRNDTIYLARIKAGSDPDKIAAVEAMAGRVVAPDFTREEADRTLENAVNYLAENAAARAKAVANAASYRALLEDPNRPEGWEPLWGMFAAQGFDDFDADALTAATLAISPDAPLSAENRLTHILELYAGHRYAWLEDGETWRRFDRHTGHWHKEGAKASISLACRAIAEAMVAAEADDKLRKSIQNQIQHGHIFNAAVNFARHKLAVPSTTFDRDPLLIGVRSGVFDVRTGKVRPARFAERVSLHIPIEPDFNADCPKFDALIEHATQKDHSVKDWLLSFLGYACTGETREEVLLFLRGKPKTGKTTLGETILHVTAPYSTAVESARFVAQPHETHAQWLANLKDKRVVFVSELKAKATWDTSKLNKLVSGEVMTANHMRQEDFQFKSHTTFICYANHAPKFDPGDGIERRVRMLRMDTEPAVINTKLRAELRAEYPAILATLLREAHDWHAAGSLPAEPPSISAATASYAREQDSVQLFFDEAMQVSTAKTQKVKTIHGAYERWCAKNEIGKRFMLGVRKFRETLAERDFALYQKNSIWHLEGWDFSHPDFEDF